MGRITLEARAKAVRVGWLDWLRKLVQGRREAPAPAPPVEVTQDFPTVPSVSLSSASAAYELRFGVVSDVGSVREHNEDNYYVPNAEGARGGEDNGFGTTLLPTTTVTPMPPFTSELVPEAPAPAIEEAPPRDGAAPEHRTSSEGLPWLFLVADGMGGQLAGEKASEMAIEIIPVALRKRLVEGDDDKGIRRAIRDAVAEANREILAQSHLVTEFANMGTTIVVALFRGDRAYVAGIGDSRAYRYRDGRLECLTTDHSLAQALVGAGTIKPEEAENHKFRHVLYNYLGCKDARDGPDEVRMVDVRRGDRFLLASDGLTGVVRDDVIADVIRACDDPQRAAQALINRALENRSRDNITCLVVQVA